MAYFFRQRAWLWPLLIVIIITPFTPFIDLEVSSFFYQGNGHFSNNKFYSFIFDYGIIPAQFTFIVASVIFLGSYIFSKWKKWRLKALSLILTLLIGAGLVTHVVLKDHWGRPRPKHVIEFGGSQPFRPYYQPNFWNQPEPSKSFPCGHCTMGFYFFALALLGYRLNNRILFWIGMIFALGLGGLLSLARIAQGGHFLSDIIISALVMWLTAYACDKWTSMKAEDR